MPLRLFELFVAFVITVCASQVRAADDPWPSLPKSSLTITNLGPRPGIKSVKTDSFEMRRDGKRVASIIKADRDGDGRWEEFVFTAFVDKQRVVVVTRLGGTNESVMLLSFDDAMVMTDVRIPESDSVALVVMSKKHNCYEIFARQPEGFYWPADDAQRAAVDASFRVGAQPKKKK